MLPKAQATYADKRQVKAIAKEKLTAGEKGFFRLAVIDEDDKVLHVSCATGTLLSRLTEKYSCSFCGTTDDLPKMRRARSALPQADIIYAEPDDIPWHDDSFAVVMCSAPFFQMEDPGKMLVEVLRVLKPGGQFLISLPWYPAPINQMLNALMRRSDMERPPVYYTKQEAMASLEAMAFEAVSFHPESFGTAVVIGWKAKGELPNEGI